MSLKLRNVLLICILFLCMIIFSPKEVNAYTYTDSETGLTWYYARSGNNAYNVYISSGTVTTEELVIPEKINGYTVIGIIGGSTSTTAGTSYRKNILNSIDINSTITSVVLPETITSIGVNTFANFQGLKSVVIPNKVTSIGAYAFYCCNNITELTLPANAGWYIYSSTSSTYTQRASFYGCSKLAKVNVTSGTTGILADYNGYNYKYTPWGINTRVNEVNILEGVTKIGAYNFYNNSYIKTITLPSTVVNITNYAFFRATGLTTMNLPDSVTYIGTYAFADCSKWNYPDFKLPKNLISIGTYAFGNCKLLKGDLVLPDGLTTLGNMCFQNCTGLTSLTLNNSIIELPTEAFYSCSGLKSIDLKSVQKISNNAFYNCTGLKGDLIIPDTVKSLGSGAFAGCTGLNGKLVLGSGITVLNKDALRGSTNFTEAEIKTGSITNVPDSFFSCFTNLSKVTLGDSVTKLGNFAFENCKSLNKLPITENISGISEYCFKGCTGLSGDLSIPDTIKTIGMSAFMNCTGLDGIVTLGSSMDVMEGMIFDNCTNIKKIVIPDNIKELKMFALYGLSDAYYLGNKDDLKVSNSVGGGNTPYIHYKNCTHKLTVNIPEEYQLINLDTQEIITTSEFTCEKNLKIGLRSKTREQIISDVKLVISKQGKYKEYDNEIETFEISNFTSYQITSMTRDYEFSIKDTIATTDLALRTYISQINYNALEEIRTPDAEVENNIISYKHLKTSVEVEKGDLITYKIRVYNEGNKPGIVNEIVQYLPEGLELANSETNNRYGWTKGENGKISTRYLQNVEIEAYTEGNIIPYEEITLICKVVSSGNGDTDLRLVSITEISEGGTKDIDSTYGQITTGVGADYKLEVANASTSDSYVKCEEDDDTDFENVVIKSSLPIEYSIKISKVDADTQELLSGAVFNLKDVDGNIISTATTDNNGELVFDLVTTYGAGVDVYYIEEAAAPDGYILEESKTIELTVTKTIIDENLGTYNLKVECQTLNFSIDITRYEFIPISTREHLEKIGTDEVVEINGISYIFSANANYKLVNDIDLESKPWTPINKMITGIFNGNGYSIKNLTITDDEFNYSEVGLFRAFSGVVQDLNLENVNIVVTKINYNSYESISGYTCVGGFAGYMESGLIKNCSISGQILSNYSNLGGFIGHSKEHEIIKFQNCTNSAKIILNTYCYNVGGLIGCALGSLSVTDCCNEGELVGNGWNVGGLVGFVNATGYTEKDVQVGFSQEDKEITIRIGNTRTNGKYNLVLENRDVKTLGLISGAKYTVYDSKLNAISGYEEIELENGKLKVATIDIDFEGTDIYYIKEKVPAEGYMPINTYIKLIVSRYWDVETDSFRVSANTESIKNDNIINEDKKENTNDELSSVTGIVAPKVTFTNVTWGNMKASFEDCINKGNITGNADIGGILGTSYCSIDMKNCNNSGSITSNYGKSGGIIAEVLRKNAGNMVRISDCENTGEIFARAGGVYSAAGIISRSVSAIEINNCVNKGNITGGVGNAASGIIADLNGPMEISGCINEGNITTYDSSASSVNANASGILAKNMYRTYVSVVQGEYNTIISDCINKGNISAHGKSGGIIGVTDAVYVSVENCVNKDNTFTGTAYDKGGIIGGSASQTIEIKNCITENSKFSQNAMGSYGLTGGIIGAFFDMNQSYRFATKNLLVSNCDVIDSIITSRCKEVAGIFGGGNVNNSSAGNIIIQDCNVENCIINNNDAVSTYSGAGGIIGVTYSGGNISLKNCNVDKSQINVLSPVASGGNLSALANPGGISSIHWNNNSFSVDSCTVEDCIIKSDNCYDGCANVAGLVVGIDSSNEVVITNSMVKNSRIEGASGNVAGIIALNHNNPLRITNCTIEGDIIYSTSKTSSNSNTAGIIATTQGGDVNIHNCKVIEGDTQKTVIYGNGRNTAGILAWQYANNTNISNIIVRNTSVKSDSGYYVSGNIYDTVSAVAGFVASKTVMEDITVENCDVEGYVNNAAAILPVVYYQEYIFDNIDVKKCSITNITTYERNSGNSNTAALVAINCSSNASTYTDCTVQDCKISGAGCSTGGMIGCSIPGEKMRNCFVKNTTVEKTVGGNGSGYTSIGGILGSCPGTLDMISCGVENVTISGDNMSFGGIAGMTQKISNFSNNHVKDLTIKDYSKNTSSSNGSIGGMIGDTHNTSEQLQIANCDVTNLNIESDTNHIGGFFGTHTGSFKFLGCDIDNANLKYNNKIQNNPSYLRCVGGFIAIALEYNNTYMELNTCTVKNSNLIACSGENSNSAVGSFIGYGRGIQFSNCTAENNKIINETQNGNSGGIVGSSYSFRTLNESTGLYTETYKTVIGDSVTVKNCSITGNGAVGGILGYGVPVVSNSLVTNTIIEDKALTENGVGGIVGMSLSIEDTSIKNTTVENSTIKGKEYAGGIAGFAAGIIDTCKVSETNITTDSTDYPTGGIVGLHYDSSSTISNSIVSKGNISSSAITGGIVGYIEGNLNNNKVDGESVVITTGADKAIGGIVGLVANTSAEITNCDIDETQITSVNGYTGGIAGFANNTIADCDVKNATIKSTGAEATSLGGIIGQGSTETDSTTVVTTSTISNSTLQTTGTVGKVAGAGLADESGCTVDDGTVFITSLVSSMNYGSAESEEVVEEKLENIYGIKAEIKADEDETITE